MCDFIKFVRWRRGWQLARRPPRITLKHLGRDAGRCSTSHLASWAGFGKAPGFEKAPQNCRRSIFRRIFTKSRFSRNATFPPRPWTPDNFLHTQRIETKLAPFDRSRFTLSEKNTQKFHNPCNQRENPRKPTKSFTKVRWVLGAGLPLSPYYS